MIENARRRCEGQLERIAFHVIDVTSPAELRALEAAGPHDKAVSSMALVGHAH